MDRSDLFGFLTNSALVAVMDNPSVSAQIAFDPQPHAGTQSSRGSCSAMNAGANGMLNIPVVEPNNHKENFAANSSALTVAQQADEADLVAQARQRDRSAYQILVERYQGRLLAAALDIVHSRADAEDIVQNAFVKAYMSLSAFEGKSSFFTWLYRIVHNLAIDERRRRARHGGETVELESLVGQELANRITTDGPYDLALRHQQAQAIAKVLSMISQDHRNVIVLREVDGLSYDEIAQSLNISRGTVMSRLHYARKRLQQLLKEYAPSDSAGATEQISNSGSVSERKNSGERYEHSIKQRA